MVLRFWPKVPYHLIQGIRLAHALMEADGEVHIPDEHVSKFSALTGPFGIRFVAGTEVCPVLSDLRLSHEAPLTAVGEIERPLIFPHAIVAHCRRYWQDPRPVRYSFAGLVTEQRRALFEEWIRANVSDRPVQLAPRESLPRRFWGRVARRLGWQPPGLSMQIGDLHLWSSRRGRVFPGKSWDEEYFQLLGRSQFVLCPSGDYVWSYRFFESILCGALPLIEKDCPAYEGFRFRLMAEPARNLVWSREDAEHNYHLAVSRLTIPLEELNGELKRLMTASTQDRPNPAAGGSAG